MGFWTAVGKSAASAGASAAVGSVLGGGWSRTRARRALHLEHDYYRKRDNYDWRKAENRGLTPQEFYGSPAAGGSPQSGAMQTLGHATQDKIAARQMASDAGQREADRQTDLQKTQMQTDAMLGAAKIAAGATTTSATISADAQQKVAELKATVEREKLALQSRQFQEIALPTAAAVIDKTTQETKLLVEQTATSTPKFQKFMKFLSMGVENTLMSFIAGQFGINPTDPKQVQAMSEQERVKFITTVLALGSSTRKEAEGVKSLAKDTGKSLLGTQPDTPPGTEPFGMLLNWMANQFQK